MGEKMAEKQCIRCQMNYTIESSRALYAEAFCGRACELEFALHILRYYGEACSDGLRLLIEKARVALGGKQ